MGAPLPVLGELVGGGAFIAITAGAGVGAGVAFGISATGWVTGGGLLVPVATYAGVGVG